MNNSGSPEIIYFLMLSKNVYDYNRATRVLNTVHIDYCLSNMKEVLKTYKAAMVIVNRPGVNKVKGIEKQISNYIASLNDPLRIVFLRQQNLKTLEYMCKHPAFAKLIKEVMKVVVE